MTQVARAGRLVVTLSGELLRGEFHTHGVAAGPEALTARPAGGGGNSSASCGRRGRHLPRLGRRQWR